MEKKARVYIMRHGPKEGDQLTEEGVRCVQVSAVTNLAGIEFDALFCSKKFRTLQTVVAAVGVLPGANRGLGIETREGFDFINAPDIDRWKELSAEVNRLAEASGQPATVALWAQVAPAYVNHIRPQVTAEILRVSKETLQSISVNEANILVGCHGPLSELACLDMNSMLAVREADIVCYEVRISDVILLDDLGAEIISSTYISRGF